MVLAAGGENSLSRIALETSASYLASFQPEPSERNGKAHRVELRVTRPDVTVRVGTQIPIARADAGNARKNSVSPRDMLREATVYRDLPLRVAAFASRDAADKLKLVALGELVDPSAKLTAAVIGVYDAKGKLTAQSTAPSESLATQPLMFAVIVPPGPYRIRVAATDASGRSGTADYDMAADLTAAGALKLSSLLLGTDAGGFKPLLQFKNEPSAMATFDLYGKPPSQLPLKLELAATADGPALLQASPSGSGTKDPDRFVVSGVFPHRHAGAWRLRRSSDRGYAGIRRRGPRHADAAENEIGRSGTGLYRGPNRFACISTRRRSSLSGSTLSSTCRRRTTSL